MDPQFATIASAWRDGVYSHVDVINRVAAIDRNFIEYRDHPETNSDLATRIVNKIEENL